MQNKQYDTLSIFTDGGARGNPGNAAIGVHATFGNDTIFQLSEKIGQTTNNIAEYTAVVKSLEHLLLNNIKINKIIYYLDSELVVRQLNGQYRIKDDKLINLNIQIRGLISKLKNNFQLNEISFFHIRREHNKIADSLVNQALDSI